MPAWDYDIRVRSTFLRRDYCNSARARNGFTRMFPTVKERGANLKKKARHARAENNTSYK